MLFAKMYFISAFKHTLFLIERIEISHKENIPLHRSIATLKVMQEVQNGRTQIVGKGRLYSWMSFIYMYKTLRGFIKGVSGGIFCSYK